MKVLLAVDGSTYSEAAANAVAKRPWPAGTTIKVFSSIEPVFYPTTDTWVMPESYYEEMEKAGREAAEKAVAKAVEILRASPASPIEVTTEIRDGHAKDAILEEADAWGADLIILGSHGYRGFKRFMLGSVSYAVATHARCSVEIVRVPEAQAA